METSTAGLKRRFIVLDSFRGIFALSVVLYHLNYVGSITEWDFFRGSHLFVEFFFVLSGFVLTHGYAFKENLSFKTFAISRLFRLYPLHLTMLAVFLIFEFGKLFAEKYGMGFNTPAFAGDGVKRDFIANLLLLHSWIPSVDELRFNYPSWSISIELYTYFVFFFLILLAKGTVRYLVWASLIIAMLVIRTFGHGLVPDLVTSGIACFFSGALTNVAYRKYHNKILLNKYLFTFFELVLAGAVFGAITNNDKNIPLLIAVYAMTIFIYSFEYGFLSKFFKEKFFVWLGKLSYSIYMTHAAIIFCFLSAVMILQKVLHTELTVNIGPLRYIDTGSLFLNNLFVLITLATVLLVSNFTYRVIEQRGQRAGKKLLEKLSNKSAGAAYRLKQTKNI